MFMSLKRTLLAGGLTIAAAAVALAPAPASARVVLGFGIGLPLVAPVYPAPVYYPPYPYAPPPVAYYPPPAAPAAAPPPVAAAPAPTGGDCREYSSTQVIDGQPQQVFGRACLQPDGTWRIMD